MSSCLQYQSMLFWHFPQSVTGTDYEIQITHSESIITFERTPSKRKKLPFCIDISILWLFYRKISSPASSAWLQWAALKSFECSSTPGKSLIVFSPCDSVTAQEVGHGKLTPRSSASLAAASIVKFQSIYKRSSEVILRDYLTHDQHSTEWWRNEYSFMSLVHMHRESGTAIRLKTNSKRWIDGAQICHLRDPKRGVFNRPWPFEGRFLCPREAWETFHGGPFPHVT